MAKRAKLTVETLGACPAGAARSWVRLTARNGEIQMAGAVPPIPERKGETNVGKLE